MLRTALMLLLLAGPRHVMFVLTGSSMAAAWVNIALMPPNGHALLTHNRQLDLPASYCAEDMDYVWQALRKRHPALPQELLHWAEPTPAMLSNLARSGWNLGVQKTCRPLQPTLPQPCLSLRSGRCRLACSVSDCLSPDSRARNLFTVSQPSSAHIGTAGAQQQSAMWVSELMQCPHRIALRGRQDSSSCCNQLPDPPPHTCRHGQSGVLPSSGSRQLSAGVSCSWLIPRAVTTWGTWGWGCSST